jgi:Transposase, Mutator family
MADVGRMSVQELVGKVLADEHADVLCQAVVWLAQELMEAEVSQAAGAAYGERSGERVARRNGYRERAWDTRVGSIEPAIQSCPARSAAAHAQRPSPGWTPARSAASSQDRHAGQQQAGHEQGRARQPGHVSRWPSTATPKWPGQQLGRRPQATERMAPAGQIE